MGTSRCADTTFQLPYSQDKSRPLEIKQKPKVGVANKPRPRERVVPQISALVLCVASCPFCCLGTEGFERRENTSVQEGRKEVWD